MPSWVRNVLVAGVVTAILVVGLIPGWTQTSYEWLWTNTVGEPFTFIMRRNPWLLFVPSFAVLAALAWCLPRNYAARVLLVWATYGLGLVAGHVVWGDGTIHLGD